MWSQIYGLKGPAGQWYAFLHSVKIDPLLEFEPMRIRVMVRPSINGIGKERDYKN